MIENPFERTKLLIDIGFGGATVGSVLGHFTLSEWAAIASMSWVAYRFGDEFYRKWKARRKRKGD